MVRWARDWLRKILTDISRWVCLRGFGPGLKNIARVGAWEEFRIVRESDLKSAFWMWRMYFAVSLEDSSGVNGSAGILGGVILKCLREVMQSWIKPDRDVWPSGSMHESAVFRESEPEGALRMRDKYHILRELQ